MDFKCGFYSTCTYEEITLEDEKYIALVDVDVEVSHSNEAHKRMADKEGTGTHILYTHVNRIVDINCPNLTKDL